MSTVVLAEENPFPGAAQKSTAALAVVVVVVA
jgi:hypothetical protein